MGSAKYLRPVDAGLIFEGQLDTMLPLLSLSPRIKKYLPFLDLSTKEKAMDFFLKLITSTELGLQFAYSIVMGSGVLGMIFVHTPEFNKNTIHLEKWSIDFFLFEPCEGQGLMSNALARILILLKTKMYVDQVLFLVDAGNTRSLSLLQRMPFDELSNAGFENIKTGEKPRVFSAPLSIINFKHA